MTATTKTTPPAATTAALAGMLGSINGCTLTGLSLTSRDGRKDPRAMVTADVSGWSPTLHRVAMEWRTVLAAEWTGERVADEPHAFAAWLERAYGAKADLQRRRASCAVGIGEPFPLRTGDARTPRFDHLHADRGALALRLDSQSGRLRDAVGTHLKQLHRDVGGYRGGATLENQGERAHEIGGHRTIRITANRKGEVTMYGEHLQIRRGRDAGAIPDTVVVAMAGRPLRDLATVHPAVDGRIVREAGVAETFGSPTLWFDLAPDPVVLADMPSAHDAPNTMRSDNSADLAALLAGAPA